MKISPPHSFLLSPPSLIYDSLIDIGLSSWHQPSYTDVGGSKNNYPSRGTPPQPTKPLITLINPPHILVLVDNRSIVDVSREVRKLQRVEVVPELSLRRRKTTHHRGTTVPTQRILHQQRQRRIAVRNVGSCRVDRAVTPHRVDTAVVLKYNDIGYHKHGFLGDKSLKV